MDLPTAPGTAHGLFVRPPLGPKCTHTHIPVRAQVPGADQILMDFRPVPDLCRGIGQIIYVDNSVFLSTVPGAVDGARVAAEEALTRAGLPVHEIQGECSSLSTLGWQFDKHRIAVTATRRWRIRAAVRELLRLGRASGDQLRIILGHSTFCFCLKR